MKLLRLALAMLMASAAAIVPGARKRPEPRGASAAREFKARRIEQASTGKPWARKKSKKKRK